MTQMKKSTQGTATATVPSNIALLKYWGKSDENHQIPANDSLSMTLKNAVTTTSATVLPNAMGDRFELNGEERDLHAPANSKILKHLSVLREHLHGLETPYLSIESQNHFPTGCGIASSASGFGALTLAAVGAWTQAHSIEELAQHGLSLQRLAHLARLGSGSAGRSFWGGYVHWEKVDEACSLSPMFSADYWPLADIIMIISKEEKKISSSAGHRSAWTSPLFRPRLSGIPAKLNALKLFIRDRQFTALGALIEQEALDMHAVMLSSTPPAKYIDEQTGELLAWVREQRQLGKLPAYFTLDAGPNIHLICEVQNAAAVTAYLAKHLPHVTLLADETGTGPTLHWESETFDQNNSHQNTRGEP